MRSRTAQQGLGARSVWLLALLLLFQALVPSGYMIDPARAAVASWPVILCPDGFPPAAFILQHQPEHNGHAAHHAHQAAMSGGHDHSDMAQHHNGSSHDGQNSHDQQKDKPCAFAGLGTPFVDVPHLPLPLPTLWAAPPPLRAILVRIGQGLVAPPPPARAPPARL